MQPEPAPADDDATAAQDIWDNLPITERDRLRLILPEREPPPVAPAAASLPGPGIVRRRSIGMPGKRYYDLTQRQWRYL